MEQEPTNESFLQTISRINFQKWHSKVRIVISRDFEFEVVVLIDSGADSTASKKESFTLNTSGKPKKG